MRLSTRMGVRNSKVRILEACVDKYEEAAAQIAFDEEMRNKYTELLKLTEATFYADLARFFEHGECNEPSHVELHLQLKDQAWTLAVRSVAVGVMSVTSFAIKVAEQLELMSRRN